MALALSISVSALLLRLSSAAGEGSCTLDVFPGISCTQSAFAWTNATDFADCCADCDREAGCLACEWVSPPAGRHSRGPCHLKAQPGPKISQRGTTCGISKALPPTPTPPPPQQAPTAWPPVWPAPKSFTNGTEVAALAPEFDFEPGAENAASSTVEHALARYKQLVLGEPGRRPSAGGGSLTKLVVTLTAAVSVSGADYEAPPQEDTDESYSLAVPTAGPASLRAATPYGMIRGLETFSQLVRYNFSAEQFFVKGAPWAIEDSPRFSLRGLMLDTSRHFIPVPMIERLLEGMAACKLSVLHWHISDDQAFPLQIPALPKLWEQSYGGRSRYTTADAVHLVEFARLRAIRVIAEFDTPGHAGSICKAYPAACVGGLINPTVEAAFDVMQKIIAAAAAVFPDRYLHLGGDEVKAGKWAADPAVASWMAKHGMNTTTELYAEYERKLHALAHAANRTFVNWVEVFELFPGELDNRTIVHVWKSRDDLLRVLQAGFRAILSDATQWYLTGPHVSHTWQSMCESENGDNDIEHTRPTHLAPDWFAFNERGRVESKDLTHSH
eukprot:SAG22_NODE_12_length_33707_cov_70.427118_3_plen_557_part_00